MLAGPLSPRGSVYGAQGCRRRRGTQLFCGPVGLGNHAPLQSCGLSLSTASPDAKGRIWEGPGHTAEEHRGCRHCTAFLGDPAYPPSPTWTCPGGPGTGGLADSRCCVWGEERACALPDRDRADVPLKSQIDVCTALSLSSLFYFSWRKMIIAKVLSW